MTRARRAPTDRPAIDRARAAGAAADPLGIVGTIVAGHYLVERVVGSGGFALVYRARHLRFDSPVALKILRRALRFESDGEARADRLATEGKFLFELAPLHPSFVRIFEMGTVATRANVVAPYLALEWLEGSTLKEEARRLREAGEPIELHQVLSLFSGIAQGLSIVHRRGIAHRDIKPANIFLSGRDGEVLPRILDFGLAKLMRESEAEDDLFGDSLFALGAFTPAYAAPEQWQRTLGATGTWTDVHALALVCVELLAGRSPFEAEDPAHLMNACLDASARPTPRRLGVEVSDAVETVFAKALAVNPRDRYRNVAAFWEALCAAAAGVPASVTAWPRIAALPTSAPDADDLPTASVSLSDPAALLPSNEASRAANRAPRRKGRIYLDRVAVLVALAGVGGTVLTLTRHRASRPADPRSGTPGSELSANARGDAGPVSAAVLPDSFLAPAPPEPGREALAPAERRPRTQTGRPSSRRAAPHNAPSSAKESRVRAGVAGAEPAARSDSAAAPSSDVSPAQSPSAEPARNEARTLDELMFDKGFTFRK